MRFLQYFLVGAMLCLFMGVHPASADVIGTTDEQVKAIAEPVLNGILEGFKTDDYALYSKDFDGTLKDAIPEGEFVRVDGQIEDMFGNCESKKYLGFLRKGKMTAVLWKAKFAKTEDDVLIKLLMSKRGDKYVVTGLWFQ